MMEAAADCAFTWRPLDWHCSSLGLFNPFTDIPTDPDPTFNQHSIAFVSSARITTVFGNLKKARGQAEAEECVREFESAEMLGNV